MKKIFYYKKDKETRRYYGGKNVQVSIYQAKRGEIVKIGSCSWCTSSYRGETSEVFNALMQLGAIPKKYYKSSVSDWSSGGYFFGVVCDKYDIRELA